MGGLYDREEKQRQRGFRRLLRRLREVAECEHEWQGRVVGERCFQLCVKCGCREYVRDPAAYREPGEG